MESKRKQEAEEREEDRAHKRQVSQSVSQVAVSIAAVAEIVKQSAGPTNTEQIENRLTALEGKMDDILQALRRYAPPPNKDQA